MDERRLDTGQVLTAGIINRPMPQTDIPKDRPEVSFDAYDDTPSGAELLDALKRGDVLHCSEYYGIPHAWRDGDTYRGALLQYREVSESPTFETAEDALEWFVSTAHAVAG